MHDRLINSRRALGSTKSPSARADYFDEALDIRLRSLPYALKGGGGNVVDSRNESKQAFASECEAFVKLEGGVEETIQSLMLEDRPVTCIISDFLVPFAAGIAKRVGIPSVAFMTASPATNASILQAMQGRFTFLHGQPGSNDRIACIPGTPASLKIDDLDDVLLYCERSDFLFDFYIRSLGHRGHEHASILTNSFEELDHDTLEYLRNHHSRVYPIGPILPPSYLTGSFYTYDGAASLWPEDYGCLKWLDQQHPASVLYVSFGSLVALSPQQIEELAQGLEASQQTVLWVARRDQAHGRLLNALSEDFLNGMRDRIAVVSWTPQVLVLCHPLVGGFLTHSGWNSTIESIAAGVPTLGWPFYGDQKLNTRFVVDKWKTGMRLEVD